MFQRRGEDRTATDDSYEAVMGAERTTHMRPWSPAQIIALVVGIAAVVIGIAGLAKTGVPMNHLDRPYHDVLSLRHSPLLGLAEIAFGVLLIASGVVAGGARWLMALLGVVQTIFGVIILVDVAPDRIHRWLGVGDPYGWLSVIVGAFLVLSALFLPDVTPAPSESRHRRVVS
jgi:hypothetical protein